MLGAVTQQAITWTNVDNDLRSHKELLDCDKLIIHTCTLKKCSMNAYW